MSFDEADLEAAAKVTLIAYQSLKKAVKVQSGEKETATAKGMQKKSLKKPRLLRAPSHAWLMISFINCCETTQKHNGIESCPKCTPKILRRI
jgi:hypothetical protein